MKEAEVIAPCPRQVLFNELHQQMRGVVSILAVDETNFWPADGTNPG